MDVHPRNPQSVARGGEDSCAAVALLRRLSFRCQHRIKRCIFPFYFFGQTFNLSLLGHESVVSRVPYISPPVQLYKEERDALEREMRDVTKAGMISFMPILGDGRWPQTPKLEEYETCKWFLCDVWQKRDEHLNVEGVSIRRRNCASARKGCAVDGQND